MGVPIVPVAIIEEGKSSARRRGVSVAFGEPIDTAERSRGLGHLLPTRLKANQITGDLENVLADMTGYTKTGTFAKPGEYRRRRED